ncbi:MAG: TetR/AcrR family transcriptional regulator [Thermodesulfovibrionia bacterium]|nr:TetR/AcrR family transcriptional regulator [Thermodesulfovibrionia bacterium]
MNQRSSNNVSKTRVLKAALKLFSSKGYSGTKMTDIAQEVGLSVGALYLRFKSKEEVCLELIKDQTKDFSEFTKSLSSQPPLKALKIYIDTNLEVAFKKKQLISLLIKEHDMPFLKPFRKNFLKTQHDIIMDILKAGIKSKDFRPLDIDDTALMIFACIRGGILLRLRFETGDEKKMGDSLYDLITKGIRKDTI